MYLAHALADARRAGREAMVKLSAEQSQHEVSKALLRDRAAEIVALSDKLDAAKKRSPSIECSEMLADMAAGGALLKVSRINPDDVFLQSPRAR